VTVLTRMLHAIDELDWPVVRACLADEVRTDYTSLFGGTAETVSGDELVSRWQSLLPGFAATQHLTGPVDLEGSVARTHVRAHHWMADGDRWTVYGHYVVRLVDGRIGELTLRTFWQDGNQDLPTIAAKNPNRRG